MSLISTLTLGAVKASKILATLEESVKNQVLAAMAEALREKKQSIFIANKQDLAQAKQNNLSHSMIDRLTLNDERIEAMASGIEVIAGLADPVGAERVVSERPNGLQIRKMRVPLGVVCMIFEARPNVTADAGALCFKSGNAVILRGGKEALTSSLAIAQVLQDVLTKFDLPEELITVVPDPSRDLMFELMQQRGSIDVIIPRGGEGLINYVTDNSKIPVIQHYKGVCHLFIDKDADLNVALDLLINGKTHRTGVCNAIEGLLVDKSIAAVFLPKVAERLIEKQVKINACVDSSQFFSDATVLGLDDFGQEYLDLEIAIRIVDGADEAMVHIDRFGSHHTEVICTKNELTAKRFQRSVDASVVMVNASSRFSDGSELGLGAEIGIATTKLHAYGPMGVESLTTEKYLVMGNGQIRA
ncbi:glutamate-5-semialdehyde dehydrogenase [uncultured Paraglaciecola sp.]|mgnify:FL=1|jgi:glutamate-5-semialdehyde dehydrogenase|uniref:glutamate-5-semialdehyde dehydrogenase n=1 Tax=uncultured Paraglaciecola sp. TaxID=1765024 RepID=UPI0025D55225|nr:glutamate-5-semialdehyde dehydrogenase [uncultured Paraglaciecola sp.]